MDDQEFEKRADKSLQALYKRLGAASDEAEFEVDLDGGALAIEFSDLPPSSSSAPIRRSAKSGFRHTRRVTNWTGIRWKALSFCRAPAKL